MDDAPGTGAVSTDGLRERLDFVVGAAARAASIHNTQPWRFQVRDDAIEVLADRDRQLRVADPHGRELAISCGAAIYNAKLAIRMLGHGVAVELLAEPHEPDVLARLSVSGRLAPTGEERRLFAAIPHRHTHRGAFTTVEVPRDVLVAVQEAAAAEGGVLHLVERPGARHALSELVVAADRVQRADRAIQAEVAAWTVPPQEDRSDGVPHYAYASERAGPEPVAFPIRDFNIGRGWGSEEPAEAGQDSHPVVVLTTPGDQPVDWLIAGQALQHMLLLAATRWIFAALYSQPLELPDIRVLVRDEIATPHFPQMVLRLGHSPISLTTPRRTVAEVIDKGWPEEAEETSPQTGG